MTGHDSRQTLPPVVLLPQLYATTMYTTRRFHDYHHRSLSGRGSAGHRRNAPFPRYLVVVLRYMRGSVSYAVFKYRFPWRRYSRGWFRGAQLIGLINGRSCQRPQAIIRVSCSFLPSRFCLPRLRI